MTNEYNPDGKEIRFIDSHYKDLFHIPDGSCVQIHYPDEMVVKPCTFIDEYHTQIGYNVFHICQFAEIMERNGASYMPEPEIMGDEAAWKVGKDRILAVQTCEDGYDYHGSISMSEDVNRQLEDLYVKFNIDHPDDFRGHSMSVSDIVALKVVGEVSFHYVDSVGFQKLENFMKSENYLKNAEMAMEDDYGMIDGIINNGKASGLEERPSVLEQLKEKPVPDVSHKPPKSHPEREIE